MWRALAPLQMIAALLAERDIGQMIQEQGINRPAAARLNPQAFATPEPLFRQMVEASPSAEQEEWVRRFAESLLQDAARAAESARLAVSRTGYVRHVNPPCCGRCAVLAGRVYRWSDGFERHPNCDCYHVPVADDTEPVSPETLVERGQVTDLSKADLRAISDGASISSVVNVRLKSAGLREAGEVLSRGNRLTPAGIYRIASSHDEAMELLARYGYIRR